MMGVSRTAPKRSLLGINNFRDRVGKLVKGKRNNKQ